VQPMTGATRCGPTNRSRCGNPPATLGASVDSTTGPWRPGGGSLRKPSGIWATDKCFRTLYPIGADGGPDTSQPGVVAPLGIALYVAGADVAVALVGSLMLRFSGQAGGAEAIGGGASVGAQTKKCPDCAETILADAKVCKHCGYRFVPREEARASRETRPLSSTKPKRSEEQSEGLPSVSTSASTVLAPTILAGAAGQSGASASKELTLGERSLEIRTCDQAVTFAGPHARSCS
jgi:hypothetical protein